MEGFPSQSINKCFTDVFYIKRTLKESSGKHEMEIKKKKKWNNYVDETNGGLYELMVALKANDDLRY